MLGDHIALEGLDKEPIFGQVKQRATEYYTICSYVGSICVDQHRAMWKAGRPVSNTSIPQKSQANEDPQDGRECN